MTPMKRKEKIAMYKTLGMVAHVDAGKTTLLEQILYHTDTIRQVGRVDNRSTFLDYHTIEKERGITVFSDQAIAQLGDLTLQLIDTPGHVDFSTEMERALRTLDYAIIILSAVEGIEGHTETVWQLLRQLGIPTIFFINKIDRVGADVDNVIAEIREHLTPHLIPLTEPNLANQGVVQKLHNPSPELMEAIIEHNDTLMERYLNDEAIDQGSIRATMKQAFKEGHLYPCFCGSALQNIGIEELLHGLEVLLPTDSKKDDDILRGRVYKIRHDESDQKLAFIKLYSGKLHIKDTIETVTADDETYVDKVNQIRLYNGTKYSTTNTAYAGQLIAVSGLHHAYIGQGIGAMDSDSSYTLVPTLQAKVNYDQQINPKDILHIFQVLTDEDPALDVLWNETLGEMHIKVMGTIQLEVLISIISERYGQDITFGAPEILYHETITQKTHGFGHFEPLKHYAEVDFDLEPRPRNSGITYDAKCSVDVLHTRWQRLSMKHIRDACKKGILTGSPLTDMHITLTAGRAHVKHTSGGDFHQATIRAIRQGIEQVENLLLEPYYRFKIRIDSTLSGRVMTDITKMSGTFDPPETYGDYTIITGVVPVSTAMNYQTTLASFSSGKGHISLVSAGYDRCHNPEEVMERLAYNKDADKVYTSISIFCSHGKAYSVHGRDIDTHLNR